MPVLIKTDQGQNFYQNCEAAKDSFTDVEICFDKACMKVNLYAESELFVTMVLKAEYTETYEYSSEQPQITTKFPNFIWRYLLRRAGSDDLITFFIDERISKHMEVTIEHKGGTKTVINPIRRLTWSRTNKFKFKFTREMVDKPCFLCGCTKFRENTICCKSCSDGIKNVHELDKTIDTMCCSICLNDIVLNKTKQFIFKARACGHMFHLDCIKPWISKKKDTCPNCRRQFV